MMETSIFKLSNYPDQQSQPGNRPSRTVVASTEFILAKAQNCELTMYVTDKVTRKIYTIQVTRKSNTNFNIPKDGLCIKYKTSVNYYSLWALCKWDGLQSLMINKLCFYSRPCKTLVFAGMRDEKAEIFW